MGSLRFDNFFKANYIGMCRYCASFGHDSRDVEEVVADVIHKHYDEYRAAVCDDATLRKWMNRRALLDLGSLRVKYGRRAALAPLPDEGLTFDEPESLLALKQSLPPAHSILIEYEAHNGCGENTPADKTRFCRERKKFLKELRA